MGAQNAGFRVLRRELQGLLTSPHPTPTPTLFLSWDSQQSPAGLPFGEPDNVPRLDQVAHVVPDGDIDAARFVSHFAGPNFVTVLCLGHSAWREQMNRVGSGQKNDMLWGEGKAQTGLS